MHIIDGHLDLAMNALCYERDITLPLDALRCREAGGVKDGRGTPMVTLPEMARGGVVLCMATLIARAKPWVEASRDIRRDNLDWPTQTMAHAIAQGQLAYYRKLEAQGLIRIVTTLAELESHWSRATADQGGEKATLPPGVILTMEGADPIVEPGDVRAWFAQGVRAVSLAHFGHGQYAAGTPSRSPDSAEKDGPLQPRGPALLREVEAIGMALDLSHASDQSFRESLDHFGGHVYASHTNCRALANNVRQFTDEQLRLIIQRQGVIGAVLHNGMIRWINDAMPPRNEVSLAHLADHIDHVCQLAGNAHHVAIGSDLDGGFGVEDTPREINSIADLPTLEPILKDRGYSDLDIANIFHGNWRDFWKRVWSG